MINYIKMTPEHVERLKDIDRSEYIDLIYQVKNGQLYEVTDLGHECPNWSEQHLHAIKERYLYELVHGGYAIGAFEENLLVGFGVLAHQFRGEQKNQLQVDLMYVSRKYRRQGIGTKIFQELSLEAKRRGAKYLYISSTETRSAVSFYQSNGGNMTKEVDPELFKKEPEDIHMLKELF